MNEANKLHGQAVITGMILGFALMLQTGPATGEKGVRLLAG